jgi:hypothetical protein
LQSVIVVSDEVVRLAGADFSEIPSQQIELRGKQSSVLAYVVDNPAAIPADGW